MPIARKITRMGMPRREEKELNKILQVTRTEPKINRLTIAPASKIITLLHLIFLFSVLQKVNT
ncbi:hypothetical protein HMPREF0201_02563 [Cedecea davisae DSM 4568]|uniref:Uncharacterized protein n=1 Tax=Cedecea davisae DSM 4568 TaxID=566551 RepID=S3IR23_9ENTR|nr:hypothetical protein HMPREF0201_02563 [Cedecea davisae DSM 4568]